MSQPHGDAAQRAPEFELGAGALCLDFANTLNDRPRRVNEHLAGYEDLLRWSRRAGLLDERRTAELSAGASESSGRARAAFRRAIELREAIYRTFSALARGEEPASDDVETLNSALRRSLAHLEIRCVECEIDWSWRDEAESFDRPIWPIARSAAELLTSDEASSVGECASDTCSWLFIDRSPSQRRKWCDMSTCGNRAKARRHYRRKRRGSGRG